MDSEGKSHALRIFWTTVTVRTGLKKMARDGSVKSVFLDTQKAFDTPHKRLVKKKSGQA